MITQYLDTINKFQILWSPAASTSSISGYVYSIFNKSQHKNDSLFSVRNMTVFTAASNNQTAKLHQFSFVNWQRDHWIIHNPKTTYLKYMWNLLQTQIHFSLYI